MHITVFSIKGFTGGALAEKLQAALHEHAIPFEFSEEHHVDRFIREGLESVPAIKVDDKVFMHPSHSSLEETVARVVEYIHKEKLKSILVPIDFSPASLHAVAYARMIAERFHLGITLAHIHQPVYDPVSAGTLDVQLHHDNEVQLDELVHRIETENKEKGIYLPVNAQLEVGEASSNIISLSQRGRFEMIIMSTKNADNFFRRLFGTVSSKVSRHSHIPVLVVPPEADLTFPGKMVIGFTDELLMDGSLQYILSFGAGYPVIFDFVHVTDDVRQFAVLKDKLDQKLAPYKDRLEGYHIRSLKRENRAIDEVLFHYTNEVRGSLVILVSHHRGFLETLGHSSVTEKALRHPSAPLMVIHHPA